MPDVVIPMWRLIGSLWYVFVGIALLLWLVGSMGGLLGIIAHGVQAVMNFGMNFLARTVALGAALALVLLTVVVFKAVNAPDVSKFFPSTATTPLQISAPANAPASTPGQ